MDDRLLQDEFVESQLRTQQRSDFQSGDDAIGVRERKIGRSFAAMHGEIAYVDLQAKGRGVEAADLGAASGDALDLGHQTAAHHGLKRIGVDVEEERESRNSRGAKADEQIFSPAAASGKGRAFSRRHCERTPGSPSPDAGEMPGR